jgi:hypothetical protein
MTDEKKVKMEIGSSGVSVTITHPDKGEQVFYFPDNVASPTILQRSTGTVGIALSSDEEGKMVGAIDYAKTHKPYFSQFRFSINLKEGFTVEVKREPKKVIYYQY